MIETYTNKHTLFNFKVDSWQFFSLVQIDEFIYVTQNSLHKKWLLILYIYWSKSLSCLMKSISLRQRFWNILHVCIKYRTMSDSAEYQNFFIWIFCDKLSTREPITVLISFCPILMIYILCCHFYFRFKPGCLLLWPAMSSRGSKSWLISPSTPHIKFWTSSIMIMISNWILFGKKLSYTISS